MQHAREAPSEQVPSRVIRQRRTPFRRTALRCSCLRPPRGRRGSSRRRPWAPPEARESPAPPLETAAPPSAAAPAIIHISRHGEWQHFMLRASPRLRRRTAGGEGAVAPRDHTAEPSRCLPPRRTACSQMGCVNSVSSHASRCSPRRLASSRRCGAVAHGRHARRRSPRLLLRVRLIAEARLVSLLEVRPIS